MSISVSKAPVVEFDVFLSHNTADKPAVRDIRDRLRTRGLKCWFDEADLRGGKDWMSSLEDALRRSQCCAIFYGPSGVGPWHEMERQLAQLMAAEAWRDGHRFGIIPVRLPDAPAWKELELPPFLRLYSSVDFYSFGDEDGLNRLIAGITQEAPAPEKPDATKPPYIGMRAFTETESSIFTGRNNYIIDIAEKIYNARLSRLLAVLGASGSGKSSLVHAGVLPRLRHGLLRRETKDWLYITLRPGTDAWSNLRAAVAGNPELLPFINLGPSDPEKWLHEIASAALGNQNGSRRLVLVVDQFEELYTSRPQGESSYDEQRRASYMAKTWKKFAQNLAYAALESSGPVIVLIAMRSDFFGYFVDDPDLGPLLAKFELRFLVQPLSESEVRAAIERPAVARGLRFDSGLVETVTQDYLLDPAGALPFLQEALRRVWEKGDQTELSLGKYREIGGLRGAVNDHAHSILEQFQRDSPSKADLVRSLFVYLTRLADDGGPDTKRRRALVELPGDEHTQKLARELAEERHRLLLLDEERDQSTQSPTVLELEALHDAREQRDQVQSSDTAATVEIAHESLLVGWQDLKMWLNERRPDRLRLRRLESTARAWQRDDPDTRPDLLDGRELRQAERLCADFPGETPQVLKNYVRSSKKSARLHTTVILIICVGVVALLAVAIYIAFPWLSQWRKEEQVQELHRQLGVVLAATKFDAATAGELSRRILDLNPNDVEAWPIRARSLLEQDDLQFDAVLAQWAKAISPKSAKIEDLLGDRDAKHGHKREAIQHWSTYLGHTDLDVSDRQRDLKKVATAQAEIEDWDGTVSTIRALIKVDNNSLESHLQLALAYQRLRKWKLWHEEVNWARANYPTALETKILEASGEPDIETATNRIVQDRRDAGGWLARASKEMQVRQFGAALDDVVVARRLDNDSTRLKIQEAYLRWQLEQSIPEDLGVVPTAEWSRDSERFLETLESMQQRLDILSAADILVKSETSNSEYYVIRGKLLASLEQHSLAARDFNRALTLDPNSTEAKRDLELSQRFIGNSESTDKGAQ